MRLQPDRRRRRSFCDRNHVLVHSIWRSLCGLSANDQDGRVKMLEKVGATAGHSGCRSNRPYKAEVGEIQRGQYLPRCHQARVIIELVAGRVGPAPPGQRIPIYKRPLAQNCEITFFVWYWRSRSRRLEIERKQAERVASEANVELQETKRYTGFSKPGGTAGSASLCLRWHEAEICD